MELFSIVEVYPVEVVDLQGRSGMNSSLKIQGFLLSNGVDEVYAEAVGSRVDEASKLNLAKGDTVAAILGFRHRSYDDKNGKLRHSNEITILAMNRFGSVAF